MPWSKFVEFAAEHGADRVEFLDAFMYSPGVVRDHLPSEAVLSDFFAQIQVAPISAFAATADFSFTDPERLKIELGKAAFAASFNEVVRLFPGNPNDEEGFERTLTQCHSATDYLLQNSDAVLAFENHGNVFHTVDSLRKLTDRIGNPDRCGICFDIGNFVLADEDPIEAARRLPFPKLIHVKDFQPNPDGVYKSPTGKAYRGCRLGEGVVPILETLKVIFAKTDRHEVSVDLELECGEDGVEASKEGLRWLRQNLQEIQ
jgi:sugar phosphate isomerase/epimerase